MLPALFQPRAIAGRIYPCQLSTPEMGSHLSLYARKYCSTIATMNTGTDTPSSDIPMKKWSSMPFFFTAAIIPQTMPVTHATSAAASARRTVLGNAAPISSVTLRLRE